MVCSTSRWSQRKVDYSAVLTIMLTVYCLTTTTKQLPTPFHIQNYWIWRSSNPYSKQHWPLTKQPNHSRKLVDLYGSCVPLVRFFKGLCISMVVKFLFFFCFYKRKLTQSHTNLFFPVTFNHVIWADNAIYDLVLFFVWISALVKITLQQMPGKACAS